MEEFVKARKDTAKLLEFVHEALNQMAFAVDPGIVLAFDFRALMGWNDRDGASSRNLVNQGLRGVASVSNYPLAGQAIQQCTRLCDIMDLAGSHAQAQRIAQAINHDMYLAGKPATTTPQRLVARFFEHLPRTDGRGQSYCLSSRCPTRLHPSTP